MTPQEALQVLADIINNAEFKGTISQVSSIGNQAQKAFTVLDTEFAKVPKNKK